MTPGGSAEGKLAPPPPLTTIPAVRGRSILLVVLAACSPHSQDVQDVDAEVVLLPFPPDGGPLAWDGWAGGFVNDYCVQCHNPSGPCFASGCHSPGDPRAPDFEQKSAVVAHAGMIRCGISVHQDPGWDCGSTGTEMFPVPNGQNPMPTDDQRALMVEWVEAGCP